MASQRLVSLRSENTETAAGSRPEEREFLHQKGCQERGFRTIAAQILVSLRSEKTETPARFEPMPSKKHAERMPHVTFGTYKKLKTMLWQDQGPKNASFCTRRGARSVDSGRSLLKFSSASDPKRPKHQQDSSPCQAKNTPKECLTWPLEPIKNNALVRFQNTVIFCTRRGTELAPSKRI